LQWVFRLVTFPGAAPSVRRAALLGLFVYVLALAKAELGFLENEADLPAEFRGTRQVRRRGFSGGLVLRSIVIRYSDDNTCFT
jgi:hypothetical protein